MRILFIGDIMGHAGRDAVRDHLPNLRARLKPDVVIANGENSAHGFGHTPKICEELYGYGVHCITSGNHVWDQREIIPYFDRDPNLIRPINYPAGSPGRGTTTITLPDGRSVLVVNAMGRLFMDALDDPFAALDQLVTANPMGVGGVNAIFLDLHAEATSEKQAMAHFLDGRISAVVGTHTHTPTADARILPNGTAYQTDAGMTGDYNSVIGMVTEIAIPRFTRKVPGERLRPAEGDATLCGVFIETDDKTGLAKAIAPVRVGANLQNQIPDV